ncbi:hypothetical protein [Paenibacillus koleovorans]|uniref:hypothetical protein n=1 Tax=Paenibacillus koleovorans TaxID=121608 RepID=UPI000FD8E188|nr:hypothetical protein [Paenibacillus koleovorans]
MMEISRVFRRCISLTVLVGLLLAGGPAALATGNPWYDKYVTYESTNGSNYYASPDSALLGWSESYLLRSYVHLYELTKDTGWLDKYTTHVNTMLSNVSDSDADGYEGWETAFYSPNTVLNGTFATADASDSTLPGGWTRFQSTSNTAYRSNASGNYMPSTSDCGGDQYGFVLKTNGTSWQKLYRNLDTYEANKKYNLRFNAKTNGSSAKARAYVYDSTTGTTLASVVVDNTSWANYTLDFVTPSAGHTLQIWLSHVDYTVSGGIAYFDNVAVSAYYPYLVHDGMIGTALAEFIRLVDRNSTTLSAYTTEANTYQTFVEDELVPKWESSAYLGNNWVNVSATQGYYKEPTTVNTFQTPTVLNPLPNNQYLIFAEFLMIMYDVNGNSNYLSKAIKMAEYFKTDLTANGTAYKWGYSTLAAKLEDTSHANIDISVAAELFNHGQVFTGTDMNKFASTMTDVVWNGSTSTPLMHNYVDGTQGTLCQDYLYSLDIPGWLRLAQFDADAWIIGANQYSGLTPLRHLEALTLARIMAWDPVKLVNQGFELKNATDATLPARWTRFQSTSSTAYLDGANARTGKYGLTIVSNGTGWQKVVQPWSRYTASSTYVVTFDGKTDGSAAGGKIWVVNKTTGATITSYAFSNTSWASHSFTFTSPSTASNEVEIYLGHNSYTPVGGKAYFDNVVIKKQGDAW